jgi:hypothetical protein
MVITHLDLPTTSNSTILNIPVLPLHTANKATRLNMALLTSRAGIQVIKTTGKARP